MENASLAPRLLTTDEVAAYLHVSRATIYRLVDSKRIPVIRIGGVLRFLRVQVDAWVEGLGTGGASNLL